MDWGRDGKGYTFINVLRIIILHKKVDEEEEEEMKVKCA